jgi:membrane carboxypeptidase/penicillin-binding protein
VGFSNDVTIAVWIGYDSASGKRRTLGGGSTGGGVTARFADEESKKESERGSTMSDQFSRIIRA